MERLQRVAVGVLRIHTLQGQPTADIVPAKRRLHDEDFPGMFEHGEIDADLFEGLIFPTQHGFALWRGPGLGNALDGVVNPRPVAAKLVENGRGFPDEYSSVPQVFAGSDELLRHVVCRLLAEGLHAEDADALPAGDFLATVDVAVTGRRVSRRNAERDEGLWMLLGHLLGDVDRPPELLHRFDDVIGRRD